jgi:hypothetical protein
MMPRHGSHAEPFRTHPTAGERFLLTAIRAWAKLRAAGEQPQAMDVGARLIAPVVFDARPVMALGRALNAGLAAVGLPLPARLIDVQADNDAGISMGAVASPTVH